MTSKTTIRNKVKSRLFVATSLMDIATIRCMQNLHVSDNTFHDVLITISLGKYPELDQTYESHSSSKIIEECFDVSFHLNDIIFPIHPQELSAGKSLSLIGKTISKIFHSHEISQINLPNIYEPYTEAICTAFSSTPIGIYLNGDIKESAYDNLINRLHSTSIAHAYYLNITPSLYNFFDSNDHIKQSVLSAEECKKHYSELSRDYQIPENGKFVYVNSDSNEKSVSINTLKSLSAIQDILNFAVCIVPDSTLIIKYPDQLPSSCMKGIKKTFEQTHDNKIIFVESQHDITGYIKSGQVVLGTGYFSQDLLILQEFYNKPVLTFISNSDEEITGISEFIRNNYFLDASNFLEDQSFTSIDKATKTHKRISITSLKNNQMRNQLITLLFLSNPLFFHDKEMDAISYFENSTGMLPGNLSTNDFSNHTKSEIISAWKQAYIISTSLKFALLQYIRKNRLAVEIACKRNLALSSSPHWIALYIKILVEKREYLKAMKALWSIEPGWTNPRGILKNLKALRKTLQHYLHLP